MDGKCLVQPSLARSKRVRQATLTFPFLLLSIWCLLYLPHLRTSPSWYGDETIALSAGLDLTRGIAAHRAIWNTFWHPYAPYQPGYEFLIGSMARLFNGDILGGRVVNAMLALGIALIIYFYGRKIFGIFPAAFAALLFLSYDQSIVHFRWIFTHNLIAFGFTILFLALSRPARLRNDITAGLGLAISAAALPLFLYGCLPAAFVRLKRPASWPPLFLPALLVVGSSLSLGWLMTPTAGFLWSDLAATFDFYVRSSQQSSPSMSQAALNLLQFFLQDVVHAVGALMLLLCLCRKFYAIGVGGLTIVLLLVQNRQNLPLFYYQAVIVLPVMMLAYAAAQRRIWHFVRQRGVRPQIVRGAQAMLLAVPITYAASQLPNSLAGQITPRILYWTTQNTDEVEQAARWINERVGPDDLVICHSNIAWLLKARTADFLQATTWERLPTWPFYTPLERTQFRYAAGVEFARFAVVGDIDKRWTFLQPNVDKAIAKIIGEAWPVVWSGPNYDILENPRWNKGWP
jgi:hypothetical protein